MLYCEYCVWPNFHLPLLRRLQRIPEKPEQSRHIVCLSSRSVLLRLNGQSEPQQRMAAVETDKELNDLLDFTAVRSPHVVV